MELNGLLFIAISIEKIFILRENNHLLEILTLNGCKKSLIKLFSMKIVTWKEK